MYFCRMQFDDCYRLGYISRVSGLKGEVVVQLDVDDPSRYKSLKSLFIAQNKALVPFFVKQIRIRDRAATVLLDGVTSIDQAKTLTGLELFIPLKELPPLTGNRFYLHEVPGFEVTDSLWGKVGILKTVLEMPNQLILQIENGRREVLIPLVDGVLEKLDRENRIMYINAPEGLISIYLGDGTAADELEN